MNSIGRIVRIATFVLVVATSAMTLKAQQTPTTTRADSGSGIANVEKQMDEMNAKIDIMRQQLIDAQHEMEAMRAEVTDLRRELANKDQSDAEKAAALLRASVEQLQEKSDVLDSEVTRAVSSPLPMGCVRINAYLLFPQQAGQTDLSTWIDLVGQCRFPYKYTVRPERPSRASGEDIPRWTTSRRH
jgi:TolA-binding protein